MGETVISDKGVVKIEKNGEILTSKYHCSYEWLIPVLEKLKSEKRLETDFYDLYRRVIQAIAT